MSHHFVSKTRRGIVATFGRMSELSSKFPKSSPILTLFEGLQLGTIVKLPFLFQITVLLFLNLTLLVSRIVRNSHGCTTRWQTSPKKQNAHCRSVLFIQTLQTSQKNPSLQSLSVLRQIMKSLNICLLTDYFLRTPTRGLLKASFGASRRRPAAPPLRNLERRVKFGIGAKVSKKIRPFILARGIIFHSRMRARLFSYSYGTTCRRCVWMQ